MTYDECIETLEHFRACKQADPMECLSYEECGQCPHNHHIEQLLGAIDIAIQCTRTSKAQTEFFMNITNEDAITIDAALRKKGKEVQK